MSKEPNVKLCKLSNVPNGPRFVQLLVLRSAIKLEIKGLQRSRPPSAYSQAKSLYGLTGSRESVLATLEAEIDRRLGRTS